MKQIKNLFVVLWFFSAMACAGVLHTFEDSLSLVNSPNVTTPGNAYVSITANALGLTLNDHARTASCAAEMAIDTQSLTFAPTDVVSMMAGTNDAQRYFTAAQWEYYRGFVLEAAIKATLPQRVNGENMTVVSGTWTPRNPVVNGVRTVDARFPWSRGVWANTPSEISATVSGTAVFIGSTYIDWPGGLNAIWPGTELAEVWIDGVKVGQITSDSTAGMTTAQNNSAPFATGFYGLPNTAHDVHIKLQSGFVYLEHVTGSTQPAGPMLLLATPSTTYQPAQSSLVAPASIALGNIVKDTVMKLVGAGVNARLVDIYPLVGPSAVGSDEIHWLMPTHAAAAVAFIAAAGGTVTPPPPPPPTYTPAQIVIDAAGIFYGQKLDGTGTVRLSP